MPVGAARRKNYLINNYCRALWIKSQLVRLGKVILRFFRIARLLMNKTAQVIRQGFGFALPDTNCPRQVVDGRDQLPFVA